MGSITFQVVGDGSVGTKTKTFTVADADINRLVVCMKADEGLTTTQALLKWGQLMMDLTKERVLTYERAVEVIPPFIAT